MNNKEKLQEARDRLYLAEQSKKVAFDEWLDAYENYKMERTIQDKIEDLKSQLQEVMYIDGGLVKDVLKHFKIEL